MDEVWAKDELSTFIAETVPRNGSGDGFITSQNYAVGGNQVVLDHLYVIESIFDAVLPDWRQGQGRYGRISRNYEWNYQREVAIRCLKMLEQREGLAIRLGAQGPTLSATSLHVWVWEAARSTWETGHYAQAVEAAGKSVNNHLSQKVSRRDVTETDLFKQCFSLSAPELGKPRLRISPDDGSDTYRSRQRGAWALAEGAYAGIRNPLSHAQVELGEPEALEYLATFSVLARWVDQAALCAV